jgi:nondiscriminating aspartyl-tRNA synthetase
MDLQKLNRNRILIKDVFGSKKKNVEIAGWVHNIRALGKIRFLLLRDISGIIQITGVRGKIREGVFDVMNNVTRESVIYVKGNVINSKQAPGGKEIVPDEIEILASADELLIDVSEFSKTELPKRLDYRFLDLHRKRTQAIFRIQSTISMTFREHFIKKGFFEFNPPSIISSSSEGGTELFPVKYFEKKAYLAQSPQLYKQMVACSMENAMTITPVWRAEKHNTVRHLNESRQMDIEMAFADAMVVMKQMEEVIQDIVKNVLEKNKKDLEILGVKLKVPTAKYLTFEETKKLLEKKRVHVGRDDLTPDAEKKLGELFPETIVFVYDWPLSGKPFYIMPKYEKADAKLSEGFDAIYRGLEISSGGQRIHLPELLIKRLEAKGLDPKDFKSYIDSFRFGAPPHAGWSIGLERLTQLIVGEKNIREACMFPRDRDRLTP